MTRSNHSEVYFLANRQLPLWDLVNCHRNSVPTIRRFILWTVGEVHFLSTLRFERNKEIQKVSRSFARWFKAHAQVYDQRTGTDNRFDYYLEGSCRNRGPIYAFDSGLQHLKSGGYVVGFSDNEAVLERVCRALSLRGITCEPTKA